MKHIQTDWNWYYYSVHKDMRFKHPMGYVQYEILTKLNNYKQIIEVEMPIQDLPECNIWEKQLITPSQGNCHVLAFICSSISLLLCFKENVSSGEPVYVAILFNECEAVDRIYRKMKQAYKLQDIVFHKNLEPSNRKIQQKKQNEWPSFLSLIPSPQKKSFPKIYKMSKRKRKTY